MTTKVCVVTGSSSGIGAATVKLFAERGWHVVVNYSREAAPAEAVAQACRALGQSLGYQIVCPGNAVQHIAPANVIAIGNLKCASVASAAAIVGAQHTVAQLGKVLGRWCPKVGPSPGRAAMDQHNSGCIL